MNVRPAIDQDVPRLCELLALLFDQEKEFAPDARKQAQGLRAIMASGDIGRVLVLEIDGKAVGMVSLLFTVSTFLGARAALLEDMIVDPAERGRGYGRQLLQAALQQAKDAGCRRITLLTDNLNAKAKAFYRRAGFHESSMIPLRFMLEP